ncbi:MAG: hypothetical protein COT84_06210 [Chlamydiae bacterium CG10_big_fil_rev_8_21_14_0_10_35_9]|nr:MAG: hypothetical protein COT84_06210 [Chlamydiae bacterium CG10_big_fil_rev_8_21_14_0_10_35_9]
MDKITIQGKVVYGVNIDQHTQCKHYHSHLDVIAIKFKCCQKYFSCFFCHKEMTSHPAEKWTLKDFDTYAVLCGKCGLELKINHYFWSDFQCPCCMEKFNPGCKNHWMLYFDHGPNTKYQGNTQCFSKPNSGLV